VSNSQSNAKKRPVERVMLLAAAAAVVIGIVMLLTRPTMRGYVKTEAVITDIEYYYHGDDTDHDVLVAYEVDGEGYSSLLNFYSSSFYVGKVITVYYDPANPSHVVYDSLFVGLALVVIGGVLAVFAFRAFFATGTSHSASIEGDDEGEFGHEVPLREEDPVELENPVDERSSEPETAEQPAVVETTVGEQPADEPSQVVAKNFYFFPNERYVEPGFVCEDADRNDVLQAVETAKDERGSTYRFDDLANSTSATHAVSNISETDGSLTFDGTEWRTLFDDADIIVQTNLSPDAQNAVYTVYSGANRIAEIATCGKYVHEEDALARGLGNAPREKARFRIKTDEKHLETAFLVAFVFALTNQLVY